LKFGEKISGPPFSFSKIFEVEADNVIYVKVTYNFTILMISASTSAKMEKEKGAPSFF
jgi:hypothetical protein